MMTPTEFSSRLKARPRTPVRVNSTISPAMTPRQAVDAGDAVADLQHPADFADVEPRAVLFNFGLQN